MKDSTKRSLRTFFQGLVGLLAAVPILATFLPTNDVRLVTIGATVVAAAAVVSKIVNALEENNLIPSWLKSGGTPGPDGDGGLASLKLMFVVLAIFCLASCLLQAIHGNLPLAGVFLLVTIVAVALAAGRGHRHPVAASA